ncbi:MAG: MFS transporter, partial [Opitutaceae bacterium]|nr:MFS transporter [Opitutaceae bacterium]
MSARSPDPVAPHAAQPNHDRIPWRSWLMLAVAAAGSLMFYLDRQTVAILKTTISSALGLDDIGFATIISAYMIPYTFCYLFSGRLIDRWGTRRGAMVFLASMAAATLGCGLAQNLAQMAGARGLLGIAESGISPATILLMTLWFPARRRAFALMSYHALSALAPVLAPPLIVALAAHGNWRWCFFIPAGLSLLTALAWWLADRNPPYAACAVSPNSPAPPAAPAPSTIAPAAPAAAAARTSYLAALKTIFGNRRLRGLILARVCTDPFYFFLMNWHVGFLEEHSGWSRDMVGRLAWIPWLFIPVVNMALAWWSDRRAAATGDPAAARGLVLRGLACLAPAAALAVFLPSAAAAPWAVWAVLALVGLGLLMTQGWVQLSGVMVSELAPAGTVATSIGILSVLSGVASIIFNQTAGHLVAHFGYTSLFIGGALLHPLGAFILWKTRKTQNAAPSLP